MPSTYTSNKAYLEKPSSGDYVDTWWTPVNANWDVIDAIAGGLTTLSLSNSNVTLSSAQSQKMRLRLTGTVSTPISVSFPSGVGGFWLITNDSTGSAVTIKTAAGGSTGVTTQQGYTTLVFSDGTNVRLGDGGPQSLYLPLTGGTLSGALALPSNGLNVGSGQLQVTGGNVTASGSFTASGNITAYSDARLKTDIETISGALALVQQMRGVRYSRRSNGERCVGVIAQEMQEVLPEVVHGMDSGTLSVAYANLTGVLIEAVKELAARVEELESK